MDRVKELEEMILMAKNKYYSLNEDDFTEINILDSEYDRLEEELKKLDPNNPILRMVGNNDNNTFKKVEHKIPMLSMDKRNSKEGVVDWFNSFNNFNIDKSVVIEPKVDGVSGDLYYENGEFKIASTRGNGKIGFEIKSEFLNCIPKKVPLFKNITNFHIRGEFCLPKSYNDNKGYDETVPLRNACAGALKKKDKDPIHDKIIFVAYQIVLDNNIYSEEDELEYLKSLPSINNFRIVEYFKTDNINNIISFYDQYINKLRNIWEYETDGIVIVFNNCITQNFISREFGVTDHHNKYSMAVKPPPKGVWTKLIDVEWNTSRNGRIVPTAILKPVKIGDAIISRATLNNKSFISVFNIEINDDVYVVRTNEVIPKILRSKKTVESKEIILEKCPSCGSKIAIKGVDYVCSNYINCPAQKVNKFIHWFKMNDIKNLGESSINNLVNIGNFDNLWQLYAMKDDELIKVIEKFVGISSETNTMKEFLSLFNKSRTQKFSDIIGKYGIPNIGIKSVKLLKIYNMNDLLKYRNINYMQSDVSIEKSLCIWLNTEGNFDNLYSLIRFMNPIYETENNIKKIKFCITGAFENKKRKTVINEIEELGLYEFTPSVNRETDILVVGGDGNVVHNKEIDAMKFKTKILRLGKDFEIELFNNALK